MEALIVPIPRHIMMVDDFLAPLRVKYPPHNPSKATLINSSSRSLEQFLFYFLQVLTPPLAISWLVVSLFKWPTAVFASFSAKMAGRSRQQRVH